MAPRQSHAPQLDFGFRTPPKRRRKKRGRPKVPGAGVPHVPRSVHPRCPLHITLRMRRHVWQLRSRRCFRVLERAFRAGCDRFDSRICHFSVQTNHIHLVVETSDARALARAIQGISIRMAKGLNRVMQRKGAVFGDRYHSRILRTPTEVRRVLAYVYGNARKHLAKYGHTFSPGWVDEFSSGLWFDGWRDRVVAPTGVPAPVAPATVWLLTTGWHARGGGLLRRDEPFPPATAAAPRAPRHRGSPRR